MADRPADAQPNVETQPSPEAPAPLVRIRGRGDGIALQIAPGSDWSQAVERLAQRLDEADHFFRGGEVALEVGSRRLSGEELSLLNQLLERHEIRLVRLRASNKGTFQLAKELGLEVQWQTLTRAELEAAEDELPLEALQPSPPAEETPEAEASEPAEPGAIPEPAESAPESPGPEARVVPEAELEGPAAPAGLPAPMDTAPDLPSSAPLAASEAVESLPEGEAESQQDGPLEGGPAVSAEVQPDAPRVQLADLMPLPEALSAEPSAPTESPEPLPQAGRSGEEQSPPTAESLEGDASPPEAPPGEAQAPDRSQEPAPGPEAAAEPVLEPEPEPEPEPLAGPYLYRGTLRSGQVLRHAGPVLVVGDVNPGAEVVAGGDVYVWGRLRGIVHAGAAGDAKAVVGALDFEPVQVRIADHIAMSPKGNTDEPGHWLWKRSSSGKPEVARLVEGRIVVDPWDMRPSKGWGITVSANDPWE